MKTYINAVVVIIAIVALVTSGVALKKDSSSISAVSVSDKVIKSGELRIGYIVYPPLLMKDSTSGKLSGISYDIVEQAAKKLGLKTNWVEEVGWGSAIEGLKDNRYDILGTEMWPNTARAREAVFSKAPMNSVVYPYVRPGDQRFTDLSKINSSQNTISVLDGEMASFIAAQDYPQAKTNTLPQLASYSDVLLNVTTNKADLVFVEPSVADGFLKSHPGSIEQLSKLPLRTLGNGFALARGQDSMVGMWNIAMDEMIREGAIASILAKYNASSEYTVNK